MKRLFKKALRMKLASLEEINTMNPENYPLVDGYQLVKFLKYIFETNDLSKIKNHVSYSLNYLKNIEGKRDYVSQEFLDSIKEAINSSMLISDSEDFDSLLASFEKSRGKITGQPQKLKKAETFDQRDYLNFLATVINKHVQYNSWTDLIETLNIPKLKQGNKETLVAHYYNGSRRITDEFISAVKSVFGISWSDYETYRNNPDEMPTPDKLNQNNLESATIETLYEETRISKSLIKLFNEVLNEEFTKEDIDEIMGIDIYAVQRYEVDGKEKITSQEVYNALQNQFSISKGEFIEYVRNGSNINLLEDKILPVLEQRYQN